MDVYSEITFSRLKKSHFLHACIFSIEPILWQQKIDIWSIKSSTDHQNMSKMSESSTNSHRPAIKQALSGQITDKHPQFCRSSIQGNIKVSESIKVLPAKKKQPKPFSNRKCILCIIMWQVTKHEELLKHLGHPNLHVRVPPTHLNEACVLLIH